MKELNEKNKYTKDQIDSFELDLEELRRDVNNIEDIKNSLPKDCFKNIPIESP
jgi:laminin gamma 1